MRDLFEDEHDAFRESFATFVERDVIPGVADGKMFAAAGLNGFLGMQIPEEHGGSGVDDPRFAVVAAEELARQGLFGPAMAYVAHVGVAVPAVLACASAKQHARWLPGMAAGECVAAVAQAQVRFSPLLGGGRLDGVASCVINGASAGLLLVPAVSPSGEQVVAVLDPDSKGLRRDDGTPLLGMRDAGIADLQLDGVDICEQDLVRGDIIGRLPVAQQLWAAVVAVAGARAVLDWTVEYVRDRRVFGRPVATFENTRHALAGVLADVIQTESLVDACVRDQCEGRLAPQRVAAAKLNASELISRAADQAMQLHGGYGYMREYPIAQGFADARFFRLHGGSSEAMKRILATELGL